MEEKANCCSKDYYKVLQCDRNATPEELKRSYQRLALSLHPDKANGETEKEFLLIQEAWSVLRNLESRKQYDAELSCQEHSELLLYDTISLVDMNRDEVANVYTYSCRCGGTYFFEKHERMPSQVVLGCDACSLSILVNI